MVRVVSDFLVLMYGKWFLVQVMRVMQQILEIMQGMVPHIGRSRRFGDMQMYGICRCIDGKMARWECARLEQSMQPNPLECNHFHFTRGTGRKKMILH